jgi:acetolactate synthase I/II/III large subunit
MMKVSDYVADFLYKIGIKHVFVVTGGAVAHLIDSVAKHPGMEYICPQNEQCAAMAADGYARVTGKMGAAMVTTGPGLTNLITGIASLYYDSLPSIFISGQVSTFRMRRNTPGVRQLGFQECPHIEMVKPITKYAVLVDDAKRIRFELEKAVFLAQTGRPGPVLIDIPDDIQRVEVDPKKLVGFRPPKLKNDIKKLPRQIAQAIELLRNSKRPILVMGAGVKISRMEKEARQFIEQLGIPVALTWAVMDLLPGEHVLNTGGFGVSSTRRGNFAIQNADLILSIGSRLDSHATGTPANTFAREAKKIVVDIDPSELAKFPLVGMNLNLAICADVKDFLNIAKNKFSKLQLQNLDSWRSQIIKWRKALPVCLPEFRKEKTVNPYVFLEALSKETKAGDILIPDTGANLVQTFQAISLKENQKAFSAFNNTPMGYSLAASIGACFANGGKRIICIIGDGGLQLNIQELGTVARHKLPIKIFLFNNHGFGIIQQTQDDWLDARYHASRPQTGLADPDYSKIAKAYGIRVITIRNHNGMQVKIKQALQGPDPVLINLEISQTQRIHPMLKYGRPIEDPKPLLDRKSFMENMLIKPMDISFNDKV